MFLCAPLNYEIFLKMYLIRYDLIKIGLIVIKRVVDFMCNAR